jgi:LemA protein
VKPILTALLAVAIAVAGAGDYISLRRKLVDERRTIDTLWADLDVALQARGDRVSDLAAGLRQFAPTDDPAFAATASARQALSAALTREDKIDAARQMDGALAGLLALAKNYPQAHSNATVIRARREIAAAADRIAVNRRKYNEALERYNTSLTVFPNNIVAHLAGFHRDDAYFQTSSEP